MASIIHGGHSKNQHISKDDKNVVVSVGPAGEAVVQGEIRKGLTDGISREGAV